jgi:putative membrane protein
MTSSSDTAQRRDAGGAPASRTRSTLAHGAQGLLMGTADVIPGVSGGTVALILGIYHDLVDSIHAVAAWVVALVRRDRAAAREHWRHADLGLLVPLGTGILLALAIGSVVLPPLIETYPVVTSSVFFGLIAGALPVPWRRIARLRGRHVALAVAGGLVAFVLAGLAPSTVTDPAPPLVFGAAAVAVCAMILPGVSGAYLLLVMGMYEATLHAAGDLDIAYLAVFAAGAATGLAAFSKLLSWLLDERHDVTMAVLVGLMAGSLRRLWPWQTEQAELLAPPGGGEVLLAVGCVVAGLLAVTALIRVGERIDRDAARR